MEIIVVFCLLLRFAYFLGTYLTDCIYWENLLDIPKALKTKGFSKHFVNLRERGAQVRLLHGSFDPQHIRRLPSQMLPAIDTQQLSCNSWRIKKVAKGGHNIFGVGAPLQDGVGPLLGKMYLWLTSGRQGGSGSYRVDADRGGQGARSRLGQRPQAHFGQRVGHELWR